MKSQLKFSATKEETEPNRLERLHEIWGYAYALSEKNESNSVIESVVGLHDHKGVLTVTWKNNPSDGQKAIFTSAWGSALGDCADNVEHEVA